MLSTFLCASNEWGTANGELDEIELWVHRMSREHVCSMRTANWSIVFHGDQSIYKTSFFAPFFFPYKNLELKEQHELSVITQ